MNAGESKPRIARLFILFGAGIILYALSFQYVGISAGLPEAFSVGYSKPYKLAPEQPILMKSASYWMDEYNRLEQIYYHSWDKPVRWDRQRPQGDGSITAWYDGSQALPAYLIMYDWSHNRFYLDRFVERVNQLLAYRWDADQDGYLGWPSAKYSQNLVVNGDFENGSVGWNGIGESATILPHDAATKRVRLLPDLDENCIPYVSDFQGTHYLSLAPNTVISHTIVDGTTRHRFQLRINVSIPAMASLNIRLLRLNGELVDEVLNQNITMSEDRGPDNWQSFDTDIETMAGTGFILFLKASQNDLLDRILIDNIVFSPYEEYLVHDFAMGAPISQFVKLVQNHADLSAYVLEAQEYQNIVEQMVLKWEPYWVELDERTGVYVTNTGFPSPGQTLPYNQMNSAGSALIELSQLSETQNQINYKDRAVKLGNTMFSALHPHPTLEGALIWNYRDVLLEGDDFSVVVEDISHAGFAVRFIKQLSDQKLIFTVQDVQGISDSLVAVWNGDETAPAYLRRLDGQGTYPPAWGMIYHSHLFLAENDRLAYATQVAYEYFNVWRDCTIAANNTGRELLAPALMLRYIARSNRIYLPIIAH